MYSVTMRRKRTNLYLDVSLLKGLKKLSEETGAPISELVRRAIDEYLKRKRRKK